MSDNREQILESIKVQGDIVRKLKAAKESKEKVCFYADFFIFFSLVPIEWP